MQVIVYIILKFNPNPFFRKWRDKKCRGGQTRQNKQT